MDKVKRFGAFGGVFTPSILTLLGVIMYLRLPWIVGQAGLMATLGIIFVAHIVSISTGLSVASIATDKKVETGGTYYIISRSLGLSIGGTLGWALFAGLSLSVSLYLIGFAEVSLGYFGYEVTLNNIRIFGSLVLFAITILTFISTSLTIKTQYVILTIMVLSILSVFLGNHNYSPDTSPLVNNSGGAIPWITLFAIFFPAVTGFEAGVAMSGDLKNAKKDIPKGTILAILTALVVYIALTVFLYYTVDGNMLANDSNVLFKISLIPQLVIAGVLGATLSSALGSILGAPRILQAVAKDKIAPNYLAKGFGASKEPRNALLFTFVIAQAGILIGELNTIARVVTIFFIITYGFINITYTVENWASSDFRPTFKIPRIISIIGALACIVLMIQLDILALAFAIILLSALFLVLKRRELSLKSGDTISSLWLSMVKSGLSNLAKSDINSRNWRPNIILFSGGVSIRSHLVDIAINLVGKLGVFTNFELIEGDQDYIDSTADVKIEKFDNRVEVLTRSYKCKNIYDGIGAISSIYGFSGFEPNMVLMGWPKNISDNNNFENLLINLQKQDYSLALLKYSPLNGFGEGKTIDIWWSGVGGNLSYALHLVRFMTASKFWRGASVRVLMVNNAIKNSQRAYTIIEEVVSSFRIGVEIKIVNNIANREFIDIVNEESVGANLSIFELSDLKSNDNVVKSIESSALIIRCDSTFEKYNALSTNIVETDGEKDKSNLLNIEKIDSQRGNISSDLDNELYLSNELKEVIEKLKIEIGSANHNFEISTIDLIEHERSIFMQKALSTFKDYSIRSDKFDKVKFSCDIIDLLQGYISDNLKNEVLSLERGFDLLITDVERAISHTPYSVDIVFSADDFRDSQASSIKGKFSRSVNIFKSSTLNREIISKIKLNKAAKYYLLYKRVRSLEIFFNSYAKSTIEFFSFIKELETVYHIESITGSDLSSLFEMTNLNIFNKTLEKSKNIFFSQSLEDFNSFVGLLKNPQANTVIKRLDLISKRTNEIKTELKESPIVWRDYFTLYINKLVLSYGFLKCKESIKDSIRSSYVVLDNKISNDILSNIISFEDALDKDIAGFSPISGVSLSSLDDIFINLRRSISNSITEIYDEINICGNYVPDKLSAQTLSNLDNYSVKAKKIVNYYVTNEILLKVDKLSFSVVREYRDCLNSVNNLIKLANHSINSESLSYINITIEREKRRVKDISNQFLKELLDGVKLSFDSLNSDRIIEVEAKVKRSKSESGGNRIFVKFSFFKNRILKFLQDKVVILLYKQSEGLLWASKIEESSLQKSICTSGSCFVDGAILNKGILDHLPFYYLNLFNGSSDSSEDFWIGMEKEIELGGKAIDRFMFGNRGLLIITGQRRSGKSSLSRYLALNSFGANNLYVVRAPRECRSNISLFEKTIFKSVLKDVKGGLSSSAYTGPESLNTALSLLDKRCAIIINDLELWWERKYDGAEVVNRIISLSKQFGDKILFIVNVNKFSLRYINQITNINTWAIETILCQPFSSKELKDLIISRHMAGGMRFELNKKKQEGMSDWDYAKLFNKIFNISDGNPGYALNLWLSMINNVSGNTIYLKSPKSIDFPIIENLNLEDALYLVQFVLNRRFSIEHLSSILKTDINIVGKRVRILLQMGLLTEKYPGVFSLNPMLVPIVIKKLKDLNIL